MKRTIIALAIALITATSTASALDCSIFRPLGENLMEMRQVGGSLAFSLATNSAVRQPDEQRYRDFITKMTFMAYDEPIESSAKAQARATRQFGDKIVSECRKTLGGD